MTTITSFNNSITDGSLDAAFVRMIEQRFGNMHGFHWDTRDDDGTTAGWHWTVDNDDAVDTNNRLYECYIRHTVQTKSLAACTNARAHAPTDAWTGVWQHYMSKSSPPIPVKETTTHTIYTMNNSQQQQRQQLKRYILLNVREGDVEEDHGAFLVRNYDAIDGLSDANASKNWQLHRLLLELNEEYHSLVWGASGQSSIMTLK
jgi:hypothetical protein